MQAANWESQQLVDRSPKRFKSTTLNELRRLEYDSSEVRGFPQDFFLRTKPGSNLTDNEIASMSIFCLTGRNDSKLSVFLVWELRLFLLNYTLKTRNVLGHLLLQCSSPKEAKARLKQINHKKWTDFLRRNYEQNLQTGLSKVVVYYKSSKVKYPIRKRGYTDHGSLAAYDKAARIDARDYAEDLRIQEQLLQQQHNFEFNLGFLQGWSQ